LGQRVETRKEFTMTIRHVRCVLAGSLLTVGMIAFAPATGHAQNSAAIPDQGGPISMVGCLTRGTIGHSSQERIVLAKPIVGSVASVADGSCSTEGSDQIVKLQDLTGTGLKGVPPGRWVEIHGRLEGNHRSDAVREVHVKWFRMVPVVPPAVVAEAAPPRAPVIEAPVIVPEAFPTPAPVATTGERQELPKTGTSLPLLELIGVLSLFAAFSLFVISRRTIA
jgi:LPXTG-motif cell wall-anchored protein